MTAIFSLTPTLAPLAAQLGGFLHGIAAWLFAHPTADAGIALWLLISIANKLQTNPANANSRLEYAIRRAIDILSLLPHQDAYGLFGGILSRFLAPGVAQGVLKLLFGWFNLPGVGSVPTSPPDVAPAAPLAPRGHVRVYALVPLSIGLTLFAGCAFLHSIKAGEVDCARVLGGEVVQQLVPEVTVLLSTGDASAWPQALAALEQDAGEALVCAVAVVVHGLEASAAPAAAVEDAGASGAPSAAFAVARRSAIPAERPVDSSLALFCALAENAGPPPDACAGLGPKAKAVGRGQAYLNASKSKPAF